MHINTELHYTCIRMHSSDRKSNGGEDGVYSSDHEGNGGQNGVPRHSATAVTHVVEMQLVAYACVYACA